MKNSAHKHLNMPKEDREKVYGFHFCIAIFTLISIICEAIYVIKQTIKLPIIMKLLKDDFMG